jgi:hypothetical protein
MDFMGYKRDLFTKPVPNLKQNGKNKKAFWELRNGELERSGKRRCRRPYLPPWWLAAVDLTSRHDGFLNFCKGPWRSLGRNSAILVRNEITSLVLYNICKVLYQRTFPKWCSPFYGTPGDGLFPKNREKSKRCVFVGVSNRKLCCIRLLELQRSFQKFSFVPVQKQNELLETQNCKVLGLLKNMYGCVKIR